MFFFFALYSRIKEDVLRLPGHFCGIIINGSDIEKSDNLHKSSADNVDALGNQDGDFREEESWSDEEGEDPSYTYNYSLRRRR